MIWSIILFIIGFYVLIKGSDILIDGSRSVAKVLKLSDWVVGVTIVGIGTSIPEFSIAFLSVLQGQSDIGLGAIVGSNTFNILVILGLVAVIYPISVKVTWVRQDLVMNVLAVLSTGLIAVFPVLGGGFFEISRPEGLLLLLLFLVWIVRTALNNRSDRAGDVEKPDLRNYSLYLSFFMILAGLVGVVFGADWVISGAKNMASWLGISETIVGLTIVAVGTSLPELAVSIRAAYRRNFGISLGNIIGSSIFDFWGILGIVGLFSAIAVPKELIFDISITVVSALLLLAMMFIGTKYVLQRWQGVVMIVAYAFYLFFMF